VPLALLGLLVVLAVTVRLSIVRVGEGERVFRATVGGGAVLPLAPGWRVSVPILHRVVRVPAGPLGVEGSVPVQSSEGVTLRVPYELTARIADAALASLLRESAGRAGPLETLRDGATAAIAGWSAGASGETLVLREGALEAEAAARRSLEARGFEAVVLTLGRIEGPPDLLATVESRALTGRLADTGTKVAILGLDGADWQIIDPLIARGQLPNLARLKSRGAWGNLKSMHPMLSPLLWTSVATGKPPEQHGIIDFLVKDARTGATVPVSSRGRKVKALWNIFSDAGKSVGFVAWWATWPAETVNGYLVSDRVAYSLFGYEAAEGDRAGATYPPGYYQEIKPRLLDDSRIPLAEVQRFVRVAPGEWSDLRGRIRQDPKVAYRLPVNHLTKILASSVSYQAIGLDLLGRGQPDLFSVYYQGIDEVCHRFAHYMPPKMGMVTDEEYAKYHDTVFAYYRYQDRLLGEVLARLSPDTTVIVMSDHGFRNGGDRPPNDPPYIEGKPGLWHRRYGILILAGPPIKPGPLDTTNLLDIAPTVLYLAGLPVAEDMEGRVIGEAIDGRFRARFPVRTIPSYEGIGRPLAGSRDVVADSRVDEEMIEQLRSLGYIGGTPTATTPAGDGDETLVTGHLNEAGLHVKSRDFVRAEAAVREALRIYPGYAPALLLSMQIDMERKNYGRAIETGRALIDKEPEADPGLYIQMGKVYSDGGRTEEGLAYLGGLARRHPQIAEIHSALGSMHLKRGEREAAEKELLEAIRLDPALGEPLSELHKIYQGTERILSLEPIVRKGLLINDKSIVHHNWMGLIYEWKKDLPQAEREFRRAMEFDPDAPGTMANLGALYGRSGRLDEAVTILSRAVAKDPDNLEAWVNLGAAQGRLRRPREAIEALETARRKGVKSTTLYNALALAYLQADQRDKALQYLKESLTIDPDQKDARELLDAVTRSS
jgi:tetratricopeptide (TPR) repeat protein